jgi:hypothetical protein
MTTIVYRAGIVAVDTQISYEDELLKTFETKIYHTKGGDIIFTRGSCLGCNLFLTWYQGRSGEWKLKHGDFPFTQVIQPGDEFNCVVISKDGKVRTYDFYLNEMELNLQEFFVIGSGAKAALGALEQGATAVQAVKIAMKYDLYSGGKVEYRSVPKYKHK